MPKLAAFTIACVNQNEVEGLVQFLMEGQLIATVDFEINNLLVTVRPFDASTETDLTELLQWVVQI